MIVIFLYFSIMIITLRRLLSAYFVIEWKVLHYNISSLRLGALVTLKIIIKNVIIYFYLNNTYYI